MQHHQLSYISAAKSIGIIAPAAPVQNTGFAAGPGACTQTAYTTQHQSAAQHPNPPGPHECINNAKALKCGVVMTAGTHT